MYVSGTTQRRLARILRVTRKTIARKFEFLALEAKTVHEQFLKQGKFSSSCQFDEMESFEHTRLKPVSIALAVDSNLKVVDFDVASLSYKGRLAHIAFQKYGYRPDNSAQACRQVLHTLRNLPTAPASLTTDEKSAYAKLIKTILPNTEHLPTARPKIPMAKKLFLKGRRNPDDPMFALNFVAAKIRHDLSRMGRRVWVTTKKIEALKKHLYLFAAYHNQYNLK